MRKKLLVIYHPEGEIFEYDDKQVVAVKERGYSLDSPCKNCCFFGGNEKPFVSNCLAPDLNCIKDDVIYKLVK